MGSLYRSQHELVLVFKQRGGSHRNNVQLGQFGRNRSNVWQYPGVNSFARRGEEGNLLVLHPTVKPVPYTGVQFLDIPEFQDLGTDVSEQFSSAIAGQQSVASALALAQLYAQAVGNTYRTA